MAESSLKFPTQAETCLAKFRAAKTTVSLATLARKAGAEVSYTYPRTIYTFDDDTTLVVTGRGKQHRAETFHP